MKKTIYLLLLVIFSVVAYSQNQQVKKDSEEVYTVVEKMPIYPGGEDSLYAFLGRNMKYPVVAQENGIQGKVVVRFVVQKNGSVGNVEIVRSINPSCDKEVIRLVNSLPKWTPGSQDGKLVPVWYTMPVIFKLD
jgi:periplasmic protein TonB